MSKQILADLRQPLITLHKVLVDFERRNYERVHGSVTPKELLHLLIHDPHFAWLRTISELIVRIDESIEAKQPQDDEEITSLVQEVRKLLNPMDFGEMFGKKYQQSLQEDPDAVMAHQQIREIFSNNSK